MGPDPPSLSQPSQPTIDGLSQRTPHNRAAKKAGIRTVSLADSVQRTVTVSYKVPRIDENREYGQTRKVSDVRVKRRFDNLARVPRANIIKGFLVWPDNCMLLLYKFSFRRLLFPFIE